MEHLLTPKTLIKSITGLAGTHSQRGAAFIPTSIRTGWGGGPAAPAFRSHEKRPSRSCGIFERITVNYLFITLVKFSLGRLMEYHVLSTPDQGGASEINGHTDDVALLLNWFFCGPRFLLMKI